MEVCYREFTRLNTERTPPRNERHGRSEYSFYTALLDGDEIRARMTTTEFMAEQKLRMGGAGRDLVDSGGGDKHLSAPTSSPRCSVGYAGG